MSIVKGVYVLAISVDSGTSVNIGSLGPIPFGEGLYAYVGSAQTNLEKRVARHFKASKHRFWHIGYLLMNKAARIIKVFWKHAVKSEECAVADRLCNVGRGIPHFGCSDCNCLSHLFSFDDNRFLAEFMDEMSLLFD
jgi:Uri superfamily endonuclease